MAVLRSVADVMRKLCGKLDDDFGQPCHTAAVGPRTLVDELAYAVFLDCVGVVAAGVEHTPYYVLRAFVVAAEYIGSQKIAFRCQRAFVHIDYVALGIAYHYSAVEAAGPFGDVFVVHVVCVEICRKISEFRAKKCLFYMREQLRRAFCPFLKMVDSVWYVY